jgi:hypothetical protein
MSEVAQEKAVVRGCQLKHCGLCAEEWYAQRHSLLSDIGISEACHAWCETRHLLQERAQSKSTLMVQQRRMSNFLSQLVSTN